MGPAEVLLLYNHAFFVVRAEIFQLNIVASLADFRHPDVTLESGLVLNTIGDLFPRCI